MTPCGARGSPVYVFSMTSVCCRGRSLTVFLYCSQGINDTAAPVTNSISIFFPFTIVSTEISEYLLFWGKEYSLNSQSVSDLVCSHSLSFSLASTWWILLFLSFALCLIALPFCSDFSTFGFLSLYWLLLALLLHMRLVLPFLPHWWKSRSLYQQSSSVWFVFPQRRHLWSLCVSTAFILRELRETLTKMQCECTCQTFVEKHNYDGRGTFKIDHIFCFLVKLIFNGRALENSMLASTTLKFAHCITRDSTHEHEH